MAITPSDFEKIWSTNATTPAYTFSDADYLKGWDFVGNLPPTRAQWNAIQKRTDEKMKYIFDNFGAPLVANTVADMTEQNRVYVYVGSEVGYVNGDWYYYDGGSWVSGGSYNAVALNTDKTLSIVGAPADAFATGEPLRGAEGMKDALINLPFVNGKNISSGGAIVNNAKRIATVDFVDVTNAQTVEYNIANGYRMYFCLYSNNNDASFTRNLGDWVTGFGTIKLYYNENYFRCTLASVGDASTVTTDDANNGQVSYMSKLSYSLQNNTLQYRSRLKSTDDFDNVLQIGMYNIPSNNVPNNAPSDFTGGTLLVLNSYSNKSSVFPSTSLTQVLISPYNKNIWMRYASTLDEWRDWVAFNKTPIVEQTKWLAIGDSITKGVYSDENGTYDSNYGWTSHLAKALGYDITKKGVRGMGYLAVGGNGISFEQTLQEVEAMIDDFNLVTVALGINDYATGTITLSALESVIDDAIQRLSTKFPTARLLFITPFNSNRMGDASTKYCCNYSYNGRSLKDIAMLIQQRCDAYGVECINATEQFLLNVYNIGTLLPDKTHPSVIGHRLLAKTMAHLMLY